MAEWFKAAVLKTVDGETRPGVRIPLPPPVFSCGELRRNAPKFSAYPCREGAPRVSLSESAWLFYA